MIYSIFKKIGLVFTPPPKPISDKELEEREKIRIKKIIQIISLNNSSH